MPNSTPFRPSNANTNAWSFNLRNGVFDSDSDSDADGQTVTQEKVSEDARLIKELDLSAREDKATYKPNPWTIARINAATRAPLKKLEGRTETMAKDVKKLSGRLVDGFKKQEELRNKANVHGSKQIAQKSLPFTQKKVKLDSPKVLTCPPRPVLSSAFIHPGDVVADDTLTASSNAPDFTASSVAEPTPNNLRPPLSPPKNARYNQEPENADLAPTFCLSSNALNPTASPVAETATTDNLARPISPTTQNARSRYTQVPADIRLAPTNLAPTDLTVATNANGPNPNLKQTRTFKPLVQRLHIPMPRPSGPEPDTSNSDSGTASSSFITQTARATPRLQPLRTNGARDSGPPRSTLQRPHISTPVPSGLIPDAPSLDPGTAASSFKINQTAEPTRLQPSRPRHSVQPSVPRPHIPTPVPSDTHDRNRVDSVQAESPAGIMQAAQVQPAAPLHPSRTRNSAQPESALQNLRASDVVGPAHIPNDTTRCFSNTFLSSPPPRLPPGRAEFCNRTSLSSPLMVSASSPGAYTHDHDRHWHSGLERARTDRSPSLLDFAFRHNAPGRVGAVNLLNGQRDSSSKIVSQVPRTIPPSQAIRGTGTMPDWLASALPPRLSGPASNEPRYPDDRPQIDSVAAPLSPYRPGSSIGTRFTREYGHEPTASVSDRKRQRNSAAAPLSPYRSENGTGARFTRKYGEEASASMSDRKRKRDASSPSPSPRKSRTSRPRSSPSPKPPPPNSLRPSSKPLSTISSRPTAYTHPSLLSDPDSEWSTLPSRTKRPKAGKTNKEKDGDVKQGRFKVPVALTKGWVGKGAEGQGEPQTKRRRVTYLPPPPKVEREEEVLSVKRIGRGEETDAVRHTRSGKGRTNFEPGTRDSEDQSGLVRSSVSSGSNAGTVLRKNNLNSHVKESYPSPDRSSPSADTMSGLGGFNGEDVAPVTQAPKIDIIDRLPSPPSSDSLHPGASSSPPPEIRLEVNAHAISSRYPATRSKIIERKRAFAQVWGMLGLPSCGMVYRDEVGEAQDGGSVGSAGRAELPITVWSSYNV